MYGVYKARHLGDCPAGFKSFNEIRKLLRPIAERDVDQQIALRDAEAKAIAANKSSPTSVGFDSHYLKAVTNYYDELTSDSYEQVLKDLAEGLGGQVMYGSGFEEDHDLFRMAKPIIERVEGKGEYRTEIAAALRWSSSAGRDHFAIFPTRQRAEAFLKVGKALRKILEATYRAAKKEGANLLLRLQADDITLKELNKAVEPDKGR
mgnify:CR=1 FL=1